jgi:hypothetical protein
MKKKVISAQIKKFDLRIITKEWRSRVVRACARQNNQISHKNTLTFAIYFAYNHCKYISCEVEQCYSIPSHIPKEIIWRRHQRAHNQC